MSRKVKPLRNWQRHVYHNSVGIQPVWTNWCQYHSLCDLLFLMLSFSYIQGSNIDCMFPSFRFFYLCTTWYHPVWWRSRDHRPFFQRTVGRLRKTVWFSGRKPEQKWLGKPFVKIVDEIWNSLLIQFGTGMTWKTLLFAVIWRQCLGGALCGFKLRIVVPELCFILNFSFEFSFSGNCRNETQFRVPRFWDSWLKNILFTLKRFMVHSRCKHRSRRGFNGEAKRKTAFLMFDQCFIRSRRCPFLRDRMLVIRKFSSWLTTPARRHYFRTDTQLTVGLVWK
jgi:hypothetical protein